jgi:hypothetical protein
MRRRGAWASDPLLLMRRLRDTVQRIDGHNVAVDSTRQQAAMDLILTCRSSYDQGM